MIATVDPAPFRRIRLHRQRGQNDYALKERFVALCDEHSVNVPGLATHEGDGWTKARNKRRCSLIDKSIHGELTATEQVELAELQVQAEAHFDELAPPPIDGALSIHAQLLKLASEND